MANEIKELFDQIPKVRKDWREDWKEDAKETWKTDWLKTGSPVCTVIPTQTGTNTKVGTTRTAVNGTWAGTATIVYTYQWTCNGANISGATTSTYVLTNADFGKSVAVKITGTNGVGAGSASSTGITVIADAPTNSVSPAITGTAQVGSTLTLSNGTWAGTATITFAYAWAKDGATITGASASTYVPVVGDIGGLITGTVTATNVAGSVAKTSAATVAVIA